MEQVIVDKNPSSLTNQHMVWSELFNKRIYQISGNIPSSDSH